MMNASNRRCVCLLFILLVNVLCWNFAHCLKENSRKIAVIGGGVSGTFFTKYISDFYHHAQKDCDSLLLRDVTIFDPLPLGQTTDISSIDQSDHGQGSRVASVKLGPKEDVVIEIGGSVFYSGFRLIMEMIENDATLKIGNAFNTGKTPELDPNLRSGLGVYNGNHDWKFKTSGKGKFWNLFKMAWRYNIDLYRVFEATSTVESSFFLIHQLLDSIHISSFFDNAAKMWDAVGLGPAANNSFHDFLDALGVSRSEQDFSWWRKWLPYQGSLRQELLTAINLCNYNQPNTAVNALVGLGSFVSAKVDLLSIMGGNQQVIRSAFQQAQATAKIANAETATNCNNNEQQQLLQIRHVKERVSVVVAGDESMELFATHGDDKMTSLGNFDIVILAAPLHSSRIDFFVESQKDASVLQPMPFHRFRPQHGEELPPHSPPLPDFATRPYTQVVTTLLTNATLRASYFGLSREEDLPRGIYMTEHGKAMEHNITAIAQVTTDGVYKIFSSDKLEASVLDQMFVPKYYKVALIKVWGGPHGGATPDYRGGGSTIDYKLYDSGGVGSALYYPNAIETSMACMELSAIGAKSVARLVAQRLQLIKPITNTPTKNQGVGGEEL